MSIEIQPPPIQPPTLSPVAILRAAAHAGVEILLSDDGDKIRVRGDPEAVARFRPAIAANKPSLVGWLRQQRGGGVEGEKEAGGLTAAGGTGLTRPTGREAMYDRWVFDAAERDCQGEAKAVVLRLPSGKPYKAIPLAEYVEFFQTGG